MDIPTAFILAQPRPWEPVSFHWQAGDSRCGNIEWWSGAADHIASATDAFCNAHVRLANGQLIIVKPRASR